MKKELKALKNDLVFAVSLIGDREKQEDNLGMWTQGSASLMVVADGAGGHAGPSLSLKRFGETASRSF